MAVNGETQHDKANIAKPLLSTPQYCYWYIIWMLKNAEYCISYMFFLDETRPCPPLPDRCGKRAFTYSRASRLESLLTDSRWSGIRCILPYFLPLANTSLHSRMTLSTRSLLSSAAPLPRKAWKAEKLLIFRIIFSTVKKLLRW